MCERLGRGYAWLDTGTPDSADRGGGIRARAREAAGLPHRLPGGDRIPDGVHRPGRTRGLAGELASPTTAAICGTSPTPALERELATSAASRKGLTEGRLCWQQGHLGMCLPRPCRGCPRTCRSAPHDRSDPPRRRWTGWRSSMPTPAPGWWRRSTAILTRASRRRSRRGARSAIRCCASSIAMPPARCRLTGAPSPGCSGPASTRRPSRTRAAFRSYLLEQLSPLVSRVRRPHRGRRQRPGDPLPLCARARRRDGGRRRHRGRSRPPFPDAAALRRGRRDRRRRVGASRGPAAPAGAVRRRPRRLLAAPPRALHGQRLAPRPAMDPAHQLPPLRRPVRALGPRAAGAGEPVRPARAARQYRRSSRSHSPRRGRRPGRRLRLAPLPDAGLSPRRARRRRRDPRQHRRGSLQRQEHHRPPGRAAPQLLADGGPLRRPARRRSKSATTCWRTPICARTASSTPWCRPTCRCRRWPRSRWRCRTRPPSSPARRARR